MLGKRIKIAKRVDSEGGNFGRSSGGQKYTLLGEFWSSEKFDKGMKSLREGAVDAYDTVMFRLRFHEGIDRWCLIQYLGKWYQIKSCNEDFQTNEIQITATEMANQNVTIVYSPSSSSINGGSHTDHEIGI